jgi:orotate phosphoribosyltransferase
MRLRVSEFADISATGFVNLVSGRRGHFKLESGHHSSLWLDLDALFTSSQRIDPFVDALADALREFDVSLVCGPLLGGAFLAQLVARALDVEFCHTERVMLRDGREGQGLYNARYHLPTAFRERVRGARVAMVDDVMSAGSALRGTCAELEARGAIPVVTGALLVLGTTGESWFAARGTPVVAVAREKFDLWTPDQCPLCAAGSLPEDAAFTESRV